MAHTKAGKVEEMFHPDARYLILYGGGRMPGALPSPKRGRGGGEEVDLGGEDVAGFASFRFDTEETMGNEDVEVVYW